MQKKKLIVLSIYIIVMLSILVPTIILDSRSCKKYYDEYKKKRCELVNVTIISNSHLFTVELVLKTENVKGKCFVYFNNYYEAVEYTHALLHGTDCYVRDSVISLQVPVFVHVLLIWGIFSACIFTIIYGSVAACFM